MPVAVVTVELCGSLALDRVRAFAPPAVLAVPDAVLELALVLAFVLALVLEREPELADVDLAVPARVSSVLPAVLPPDVAAVALWLALAADVEGIVDDVGDVGDVEELSASAHRCDFWLPDSDAWAIDTVHDMASNAATNEGRTDPECR